jgi:hypothetical protein
VDSIDALKRRLTGRRCWSHVNSYKERVKETRETKRKPDGFVPFFREKLQREKPPRAAGSRRSQLKRSAAGRDALVGLG